MKSKKQMPSVVKALTAMSILGIFLMNPVFAANQGNDCFKLVFNGSAERHDPANAYLLMLASYYMYENALNVKGFDEFQTKYQELFTKWGMTSFDFINIRKRTGDTQAVIMSNEKTVIVAFRGSEASVSLVKGIYDWLLTDFNFFKKKVPLWGPGVKVHRGFYNGVDIAYPRLKTFLNDHLGAGGKKLWITGHSLGAGLAPIAAIRLACDGVPVQGVAFYGGPRAGNSEFVDAYQKRISNTQRWVNNHDLVTMAPFTWMNFQHVCSANNIYEDGKAVLNDQEFTGKGRAASHYPGLYLQNLYNLLSADQKLTVPAPPTIRAYAGPSDPALENVFRLESISQNSPRFQGGGD